jgi:hypothetical protein
LAQNAPPCNVPSVALAADTGPLSLAGSWKGRYFYPFPGLPPVEFRLALEHSGNVCRGRTEEPNTFGDPSAPKLFADIECTLTTGPDTAWVALKKVYDGTGGARHRVDYLGQLSVDGRTVSGTWRIGAASGAFCLTRQ